MKAVTAAEMREIDRISIEEFLIPGTVLMNNAGKRIADFVFHNLKSAKADIFCGTGNNGGDGFTAAWYLKNYGADPVVYVTGAREKITPSSHVFLGVCEKLAVPVFFLDENSAGNLSVRGDAAVIDAITGTGFEGALHGIPLQAVNLINRSSACVVAADIPSGLPSDGEAPAGAVIKADYTITMGLPKISLITYPGIEFCGELTVADIGFIPSLTQDNRRLKVNLIDPEFVKGAVPSPDSEDIHKGDKGNTLIIGGLNGMEGAAMLAAEAMFRTGTGLVTLASTEESRRVIAGKIPELMTAILPAQPDAETAGNLLTSKRYTTLIIGPGLGRDPYAESLFYSVIESAADSGIRRVLIDGDGLYHLAAYLKSKTLSGGIDWIITPHFMEASRLTGLSVEDIKKNRLKSCIQIAEKTGCVSVLKGPGTIVSDGVNSFINRSGNRGLATAGSGDVLSGIIGALLNRTDDPVKAAACGVYIHGLCAEIYSESNNIDSMSSSDIPDYIRPALNRLT